jgi:2-methylcitrate dehydratase
MVAAALLDGELGPNQFTNERIRDPQLKSMIKKIKVRSDPNLTKIYPRGIPAILEIIDNVGKIHRKRVEFPRGHHRNPMTDKEIEEKFRALTINTITKDRADEFLRKSWKLESITDISDLLATLIRS